LYLLSVVYQSGPQEHCRPSGMYLHEQYQWCDNSNTHTYILYMFTTRSCPCVCVFVYAECDVGGKNGCLKVFVKTLFFNLEEKVQNPMKEPTMDTSRLATARLTRM